MENIPLGLLAELLKSLHYNVPNTISVESIIESELQMRILLAQAPPLLLLPPTPTVTPPSAPTVSPALTVASDVAGSEPATEEVETSHVPKEGTETVIVAAKKARRIPVCQSKTYSDCEKKHFLDVAYENNWGTTVAANKFTRIWGKGPTRRMFYWWREQFKRDHDRDKKSLATLQERKVELSLELTKFCQSEENLRIVTLAERAKQCLEQLEIIEGEIESLLSKKLKSVCSITGEKCTHGDGIQEENPIIRKFTTPFICDHCKMPFQKETTCLTHQILCEPRCVQQYQLADPPKHAKADLVPVEIKPEQPTFEAYNTELTEMAEQLIARLAAECTAQI
uniref:C2H2-type domain-containing protein n=1 Tax=Caenorhabditis tropicalis TaxID=1561998 RepID=A0A1I7UTT5_9PELO